MKQEHLEKVKEDIRSKIGGSGSGHSVEADETSEETVEILKKFYRKHFRAPSGEVRIRWKFQCN